MLRNKRGIEMAMGVLVTIIIGIVILGMGLYITFQIVGKAGDQTRDLDSQTTSQLNALLAEGQKVAIPDSTKSLSKGEALFGLGILNTKSDGYFLVSVTCQGKAPNPDPADCGSVESGIMIPPRYTTGDGELIEKDNSRMVPIIISGKGMTDGTHVFKVEVFYDTLPEPTSLYDTYTHLIYVIND